MKIGELAARSQLRASAIRYYEKRSLLSPPGRLNGQRRYPSAVLDRVLLIRFAAEMGFKLDEIRLFLTGFRDNLSPSPRWRKFAGRKILEIQHSIDRAARLQKVLRNLRHCRCASLHECVTRLDLSGALGGASRPAPNRQHKHRARRL